MRAIWLRVGIAGGVALLAFIAAVAILNQTVYTPVGFVRGYLDALDRHDVNAALSLAGPTPSSSADDALLTPEVLGDLESFSVTETGTEDGLHVVVVDFMVDDRAGRTSFRVERAGAVLGIFPTWRFASSPLAQIDITVQHARDFTANGVRFVAPVQDVPSTYLAFTPGAIVFAHDSRYQTATPKEVVLGSPRNERRVTIDAEANEAFRSVVEERVHAYLDECATQQRLFPIGCPFGHHVADPRLATLPAWSILEYPLIVVQPTSIPGEWSVPQTPGIARLEVEIIDTYDGTIYTLDTQVEFSLGFVVTFVGPTEVVLTPVLG